MSPRSSSPVHASLFPLISRKSPPTKVALATPMPTLVRQPLSSTRHHATSPCPISLPTYPPGHPPPSSSPAFPPAPTLPWFASNLTTSLTQHISTTHPDLMAGGPPNPRHHIYPLLHSLQRLSLTRYNNHMWSSTSCSWSQIKTVMQVRTHTLYTASSYTSRPYHTANGPHSSDTCPICPYYTHAPPPKDTIGHWLGACSHPSIKSAYIARHNRALYLI
jgi:hypothetical protein